MHSLEQRGRKRRSTKMAIHDRNLAVGTKLWAKYKGAFHRAEVIGPAEGKPADLLRYRLVDGRTFTSPSSAGKALMDGNACNGWAFWTEGEPPISEDPEAPAGPPAPAPRKKKGGRRAPPMPALNIVCDQCGEMFPDPVRATEHFSEAHPA